MTRRAGLQRLCVDIGEGIHQALAAGPDTPKIGFVLMLAVFGEGGDLAYVSDANRTDVAKVLYEWLEHAGTEGVGAPLGPTLREAASILRLTRGRGLANGAITPARAFAMGVQVAMGWARDREWSVDEATQQAIALLEMMILGEPFADAELAVERGKAQS
jgi:hypothetical protein